MMTKDNKDNVVNFQEGKIYKMYCNVTGECYYGSTTQTLAQRVGNTQEKHNKPFRSKSNYIKRNFDISLVEAYPCDSKEELHKCERFHIENNSCINKHAKEAWIKEYKEINKEAVKAQRKEYYEANKEKIKHRLALYCLVPSAAASATLCALPTLSDGGARGATARVD